MEERRPTPLPPGVMPSSSNENLYAQLQADSDAQKREERLLKPASASSDEEERPVERRRRRKVSSPREKVDAEIHPDVEPPVMEGPSAWRPPQTEVNSSSQTSAGPQQPRRFRLPTEDLEGDSDGSDTEPVTTPLEEIHELVNKEEEATSPNKKKPGLLKDLLGTFQKPSTPPRPLSPFKRHNKVAPIPSPSAADEGPVQERTTSPVIPFHLEDDTEEVSSRVTSFDVTASAVSGDATVIANMQVAREQGQAVASSPRRETPLSIPHGSSTKEAGMRAGTTIKVDVEPLYSPVLKPKRKEPPPATSNQKKAIVGSAVAACELASNPSVSNTPSPALLEAESPTGAPLEAKITPLSTPVDDFQPHVTSVFGGNGSHYETLDAVDPATATERSRRVYIKASSGSDDERESRVGAETEVTSRRKGKSSSSGQRAQKKVKSKVSSSDDAPTSLLDSVATDMHVLHYAALKGSKKEMTEILAKMRADGVSVDLKDSEGRTALMHAVHCEHVHCIKLLVDHGANINLPAFDGSTVLHQAAYMNSSSVVALLLSLGADGLIKDNEGRLPLHWATNNCSPQCIKLMLDKVLGLDVNAHDYVGMTPLMWAAYNNQPHVVLLLKELGGDASLADIDGMRAVHWAVHKDDTAVLRTLVNVHSSKYRDNRGRTVIHILAEQGCSKGVSLLRAVRPNCIDDLDTSGRTPLHWATACERPETIRTLLEAGADPTVQDAAGFTAMDYAVAKGYHYCSLLLSRHETAEQQQSRHDHPSPLRPHGDDAPWCSGVRPPGVRSEVADGSSTPTRESLKQARLLKVLSRGSWLLKFTGGGRGPLHKRFFWLNVATGKICWSSSANPASSDIKAGELTEIKTSASPSIHNRKDFDPVVKHKYSFCICTTTRTLDVVANSSTEYKLWLNGVGLFLDMGKQRAAQVVAQEL